MEREDKLPASFSEKFQTKDLVIKTTKKSVCEIITSTYFLCFF